MIDIRNKYNVEAPRCKGAYLESAPGYIWTEPGWLLDPKIDGQRETMQIGKNGSLLVGRNRQDFLKGVYAAGEFRNHNHMNPEIAAISCSYFEGTVLDGELTEVFKQNGEYDKDTVARMDNGDFLGYTAWTVLFYKGRDVRWMNEGRRKLLLDMVIEELNHPKIQAIECRPATLEDLQRLFELGFEGAVAKNTDMPIPEKGRTNPFWWKLKGDKKRTVDAFIIGVTEGSDGGSGLTGVKPVKNGSAASFIMGMLKDGKVVEVAKMSNLTDASTEWGYRCYWRYDHKVAEMQVSGFVKEAFRWPRFVKWRPDKSPQDCQWAEQIGKRRKK